MRAKVAKFRALPERSVFALSVLALLSLLLAPGARAGPEETGGGTEGLKLAVQVGWEGRALPGQAAPAVVTLENKGWQDLAGVIEVVNYAREVMPPPPGSPPGTPPGPALYWPVSAYGERVSLPVGSRKDVVLWFRLESPERMTFRFRSGQETLASLETSLPGAGLLAGGPVPQAVGVLGDTPPALEKVRLVAPDGVPRAPLVIPLTARLFPAAGEYLGTFRTILVSGNEVTALDQRQSRALAEWVEQGGNLILAGGLRLAASASALPEGVLKVESRGLVGRSDWRAMTDWLGVASPGPVPAAVAQLTGQGGEWGPEKAPLARRVKLGMGEVTVLAFDPGNPPWEAGDAGQTLWKNLLAPSEIESSLKWGPGPGFYLAANMSGFAGQLPQDAFPDWRVAGLYLLIFLLLAGPVTHMVLHRRRRPEYAWLLVPALAVIFAGAAYSYMLQTGRNVLINAVQAVEIDQAQAGNPFVYTGLGFFAPTRPDFTAIMADPGHPVQVQYYGGPRPGVLRTEEPGNQQPLYTLIQGTHLEVRFAGNSQWGMRNLAYRQEAAPGLENLKAELRVEGSRLSGRIVNGSGLRLDNVTMFFGSEYRNAGDLEPGEEGIVEIEIPPLPDPLKPNYRPPYPESWRIFLQPGGPGVNPAGQGAAGSSSVSVMSSAGSAGVGKTVMTQPVSLPIAAYHPDVYQGPSRPLTVEEQRRASLLDNWTGMKRRGPVETGWPLAVVAWSRDPAAELGLKGLRTRPHYLTMLMLRPQLLFSPGAFELPGELTIPEVLQADVRGMFGYNNMQGLDGGSITFAYRPQLPSETELAEITVHLPYYPVQAQLGSPKAMGGPPSPVPAAVEPGVLEVYNPRNSAWEKLAGKESFSLGGGYAGPGGEVLLRVNGSGEASGQFFYFLPPRVGYRGVTR